MPATDCRKDVLGWQLTSGKYIKAQTKLRGLVIRMRECDLPADESDRQAAKLYAWRMLDLEQELEHGPDAEPVKAPNMKQVFDICSGFDWPTTRVSGAPLFPEWKKTAGPKPKPKPKPAPKPAPVSALKKGKRDVSVHWVGVGELYSYSAFRWTEFPEIFRDPVVIVDRPLDLFADHTPSRLIPAPLEPLAPLAPLATHVPFARTDRWSIRPKIMGKEQRRSVLLGKETQPTATALPRGKTTEEAIREAGGDIYMALLDGKARAVLETGGIEGLPSYGTEMEGAIADLRQVYGGVPELTDDTLKGIIEATIEKARRGQLLNKAREEDQRQMKLDLLMRVYVWFSHVASEKPVCPLTWWGEQGLSSRRQGISWDQFHAAVVFLGKNLPAEVKTVRTLAGKALYKIPVQKPVMIIREQLEGLDLSGVPVDYKL